MQSVVSVRLFSLSRKADQEAQEFESRLQEQGETLAQLTDDITKTKALTFKENKCIEQQNEQNEKLSDEIRSVFNLIAFEAAKLDKGQIDE